MLALVSSRALNDISPAGGDIDGLGLLPPSSAAPALERILHTTACGAAQAGEYVGTNSKPK